jgi:hypothetical protein
MSASEYPLLFTMPKIDGTGNTPCLSSASIKVEGTRSLRKSERGLERWAPKRENLKSIHKRGDTLKLILKFLKSTKGTYVYGSENLPGVYLPKNLLSSPPPNEIELTITEIGKTREEGA